jgi:hypothetical protein
MQHAHSHVQIGRMSADDDQPLARIDDPARSSRRTRVGHSDVTLGLRTDLVDLDPSLADDYERRPPKSSISHGACSIKTKTLQTHCYRPTRRGSKTVARQTQDQER